MAKYSREVIEVRRWARELIPKLLEEKPRTLDYILSKIKIKYAKNCDDQVKCICGKQNRSYPEWQHQVRWAIQDLKYHGKKIMYDKATRLYSVILNNN